MAFDVIGVGTLNQGDGDTLRNGGIKINNNFAKAVEGPASATADAVAVFDGTTGKLLKDGTGTVTAGKFAPTANTVTGNGMFLPAGDTLAFSTAGAERLRVDSSGNVGIGLTPTSRNNTRLQIVDGIGFPATQVASTDANTLDDYEEGTWTPALTGSTGGAYGAAVENAGSYTKIGNIVTVIATLHWTSQTTAYSGLLLISGLPFANNGSIRAAGPLGIQIGVGIHTNGSFKDLILLTEVSSTSVYIIQHDDAITSGDNYSHSPTVLTSGRIFGIQLTYRV
jgi:hypothetical protein